MKVRKTKVELASSSWTELNKFLSDMNEEEVIYALELENIRTTPRSTFMKRLNQRLAAVKIEAIREELK